MFSVLPVRIIPGGRGGAIKLDHKPTRISRRTCICVAGNLQIVVGCQIKGKPAVAGVIITVMAALASAHIGAAKRHGARQINRWRQGDILLTVTGCKIFCAMFNCSVIGKFNQIPGQIDGGTGSISVKGELVGSGNTTAHHVFCHGGITAIIGPVTVNQPGFGQIHRGAEGIGCRTGGPA